MMQLTLFTIEPKDQEPMSQRDAFVHFFKRMDLEMIDIVLDRETYMEIPKAKFMGRLERAFEMLKGFSDWQLKENHGTCLGKGCEHFLDRAIEFAGNRSGYRIALVLLVKDGKIEDIAECARFRGKNFSYADRKMIVLSYMKD
jgi:hypothetical protein